MLIDLVSVPGYVGAGYIIFDPVSGDGAYKISDGGNGGFLFLIGILATLLQLFSIFFAFAGIMIFFLGAILPAILLLIGALVIYSSFASVYSNAIDNLDAQWAMYGRNLTLATIGLFGGPVGKAYGFIGKVTGSFAATLAAILGFTDVVDGIYDAI